MNCVNIRPCLSGYPPIAPSRSSAPVKKLGFPASFRLNKLSSAHTVASLPKLSLRVAPASTSRYKRSTHVCLFGGSDQATPKEALENLTGIFKKEPSVEELLRQQIKKQEFSDDGGSGKGGGGLGGGGGGGNYGFGGSEDGNTPEKVDHLDELMQVIMATLGFIFMYIYILEGQDINRYTLDIFKYIFTGKKSLRLQRLMKKLKKIFREMKKKKKKKTRDPNWLARAIARTATMYYTPEKPKSRKTQPKEPELWADDYYY